MMLHDESRLPTGRYYRLYHCQQHSPAVVASSEVCVRQRIGVVHSVSTALASCTAACGLCSHVFQPAINRSKGIQ